MIQSQLVIYWVQKETPTLQQLVEGEKKKIITYFSHIMLISWAETNPVL